MNDSNLFLLSWDMTGLEAVVNITMIEKGHVWEVLKNGANAKKPDLNHIVNSILLRARYNQQRHYEVYTVWIDSSMDEDSIREMFDTDPQVSADLIRERGTKVYSDRLEPGKQKIT